MNDNVRLGLVATVVVLLHGAIVLVVLPSRAPSPALVPPTTWIGLSAPAPERPQAAAVRSTSPTESSTPVPLPSEAGELDTPSAAPSPSEPAPALQETPGQPVPPAVQTPPRVPTQQVLARLVYPPLALRRRLEATVVLDLLIDETGVVTPQVVEDPGHGFAEAAVRAFEGVEVTPARVDGNPVASRLRYPVRFVLP